MTIGSDLSRTAYEILLRARSIKDASDHQALAGLISEALFKERERAARILTEAAETVPAAHPSAMDIRRVLRSLALDIRRGEA